MLIFVMGGLQTMHLLSSQELQMEITVPIFSGMINIGATHSLLSHSSCNSNISSLSTSLHNAVFYTIVQRKPFHGKLTFLVLIEI